MRGAGGRYTLVICRLQCRGEEARQIARAGGMNDRYYSGSERTFHLHLKNFLGKTIADIYVGE